ncbi:hypothetical protein CMV52_00310 [Klebsiella pneumoniae]|nr:hypothetical protein CMV52_00310 [Klebsiella pneumoniae]
MITLLRVDHRLLHGQVAFSWTQYVGADCILIANDSVPGDELRKTTIKLAKPPSVKLVIKNINDSIEAIKSGVTDKYNLFIVVESVNDAWRIASAIDEIKSINLGGIKAKEGSKNISKAINLLPTEIEQLQQLVGKGVEVEIRQVPNDRKQLLRNACNSGGQIMVEALLLGLVAFIAQSEYALGTSLISRPIVTGLLTGLVLGDVQTGVIMGATLELAFIGSFSVGASIPPDVVTGGILGVAFAITSGAGTETALLLGLPIATLTLILKNIYLGMFIPMLSQRADGYAERADLRGIERMHLIAGFGLSLMLAAVVTVSFLVGSNAVKSLLDTIPEFIKHGLSVATGIIPALGFAMLARLLINKKVAPYFFLGFVLMAYLKIPVTGIAILGAIVAVVMVNVTALNSPRITTEQGVSDDDEDDF